MRKVLCFLCVLLLSFGSMGVSHALLYDRGGGLIYDSDKNITWLQNANYGAGSAYDDGSNTTDGLMTWGNAVAWADQLEYQGYSDWRLPTTVDGPWVYGYDGTTTAGYNITSSEMGYMFYNNLGNLGYYDTSGSYVGDGNWGLNNTGPFTNLQSVYYWSGTEYSSVRAARGSSISTAAARATTVRATAATRGLFVPGTPPLCPSLRPCCFWARVWQDWGFLRREGGVVGNFVI